MRNHEHCCQGRFFQRRQDYGLLRGQPFPDCPYEKLRAFHRSPRIMSVQERYLMAIYEQQARASLRKKQQKERILKELAETALV